MAALRPGWEHAARFPFGLGMAVLVRLAEAARPFEGAFALGMAFQAEGAVTGATDSVAGQELVARIVASMSIAVTLYLLRVRIRAVPDLSGNADIDGGTGVLLTAPAPHGLLGS